MPAATRTTADAGPTRWLRAERALAQDRLAAPATVANVARNARAGRDRHARWRPARDALWRLLAPLVSANSRVAVVGAGSGDDVPVARLANAVRELVLIDVDAQAATGARRRQPRELRRRIDVIEHAWTAPPHSDWSRAARVRARAIRDTRSACLT